ncbi:hypothetical protein EJ05DRAFT_531274 [Pseudovirgaria hyperparasitica]|uniref:Aminoglycoside phosphotransferase domain-containing protein n=1 Tax=Pseudovirgaria hyperparasitica TaxID=470096 RepID=A0A6A6WBD1_9PEZI|nr:uncharacterized protein EJ05DRAFT_531274 [Pseudovirgaria hyperparasitica]KAF2759875.1 hypothetical protein EJ05DRAFT_531274 [Pseudovirgaria hyperparasitica]
MDCHKPSTLLSETECAGWLNVVIQKRQQMLAWVTSLHPQKLACESDGNLFYGSYNFRQKVTFSDGTSWVVRFPLFGNNALRYTDEKVAMEVEMMTFIREKTTIPVPRIRHWGLSRANPLGVGPFIIMDYIEGVSLTSFLIKRDPELQFSHVREDVDDETLETLYRQFANILLQLFQHDFERIGSLPALKTGFDVPIRPLTFKAHDILQAGGVSTFGDRSKGFATTTEYFQYVLSQDWEQLIKQRNSRALRTLLPSLIHPDYDRGPFKIICDDLSLANVIVRSEDDLTIVGIVDLEWSYIGPAQLFGSAPWWLLGRRLVDVDTRYDEDHPETTARYLKYLEIFKRVLGEEEARMPGYDRRNELSKLVQWSESSGAMWLHMLLSVGFNHPKNLPCVQLEQHIGSKKWGALLQQSAGPEMDVFVEEKVVQLAQYERDEKKALKLKDGFYARKISMVSFLATVAALEGWDLTSRFDPVPDNIEVVKDI